jgi:hypothetical protein
MKGAFSNQYVTNIPIPQYTIFTCVLIFSEKHVVTAPNTHKIVSYRLPAPTILKTSTCSAEKIFHNVTLIGGMKAANITSLGKASNMQECIGMSCDYGQGDLVLMLEKDCYTVKCVNERVCQTAPAQPSKFFSRVAYLKWGSTINETGIVSGSTHQLFLMLFQI